MKNIQIFIVLDPDNELKIFDERPLFIDDLSAWRVLEKFKSMKYGDGQLFSIYPDHPLWDLMFDMQLIPKNLEHVITPTEDQYRIIMGYFLL
jgi:hypothetical protein